MKYLFSQQSFRTLALVSAFVLSVFSLGVQAQNDNVSVSINTLIDQGGSSMNYELTVENRGTVNESFDMWIVVTGPNGYNDLLMNRHFNLRPGRTIIKTRHYTIQGADLGVYTFTINAGTFATGTLIDTDFDTYNRTTLDAGTTATYDLNDIEDEDDFFETEAGGNVSVSINTLIDQGGSSMNYELTVENRGTVNESFDFWIVVTGPNSYNDLLINRHLNLRPGRIIIRTRPYVIQGTDLGVYTFTINAGTFATGTLIDTDFDTYNRTSVNANELQINKDMDLTGVPEKMMLAANYPNPFNPSTTISYGLNEDANVSIMIYNALGQEVTTLINTQQTKGFHSVVWNGRDNSGTQVTSGIYFYRMIAGNFVEVKKMLLNK